jgi:glycosyltransferase involved in cell wall biosynthesis
LFATADSLTNARLESCVARGYEEDSSVDAKVSEYLHLSNMFEQAGRFDLIHSHYDFMALAYSRLVETPVLTTIHGFSSPQIMPVYRKYARGNFVSISDSDRSPDLDYLATVYNGIDCGLYPLQEERGRDLVFLGRIHPDKGLHLALEVAALCGRRLLVGGIVQDQEYFDRCLAPRLGGEDVVFLGALDVAGKNELFSQAYALLHLHTIPERFGLVLAEANCAGVPVIAMDLGSPREVLEDKVTGFLVNSVEEAVAAIAQVPQICPKACRARVEERFSISSMVEGYETVYREILNRRKQIDRGEQNA